MFVPRRRKYVTAVTALLCALAPSAHADINGFNNGSGFTLNGNPSINGNTLQITTQAIDQSGNPQGYQESNSAYFNTQQSTGAFDAQFTYQLGPVSPNASVYSPADGFTFILQNSPNGASATGSPGGFLGANVPNSAALAFNIYGLFTVGTTLNTGGNVNQTYDATGDVNWASGHAIDVNLSYQNDTLTEILKDTITDATFSTSYATDIASDVGGQSAYVGFSGGTGGGTADQYISNFSFKSVNPVPEASTTLIFVLLSTGLLFVIRRRRSSTH